MLVYVVLDTVENNCGCGECAHIGDETTLVGVYTDLNKALSAVSESSGYGVIEQVRMDEAPIAAEEEDEEDTCTGWAISTIYLRTGVEVEHTSRYGNVRQFPFFPEYGASGFIKGDGKTPVEALAAAKSRGREILAEIKAGKYPAIDFGPGAKIRDY